MAYQKLNIEPIEIEYGEDDDFFFLWDGIKYKLSDFIRTHNNPWVSDNFPDYIHGYESENYYNPLFIELIDDVAVNMYKEIIDDKY